MLTTLVLIVIAINVSALIFLFMSYIEDVWIDKKRTLKQEGELKNKND